MGRELEEFPQLVDATVIAKITGLPKSTIWRGVREGKIPHYEYGNRYKFDPREVLESLKNSNYSGVDNDITVDDSGFSYLKAFVKSVGIPKQ